VGFTAATELADTIARIAHVPFRTAHTVVGELARFGRYDLETIDRVGIQHVGKRLSELGLTADDVSQALDVNINVARRDVKGGPAATEVTRMVKARRRRLRTQKQRLRMHKNEIKRLENDLLRHPSPKNDHATR
jgi:argininosuccinate lyase